MASITWHVSTLAAAVLCGLLILAPITDASAEIRIGSISNIDSSDTVINGVTLDAPIMAASRAKLLDPEHFRGEGDAFPPRVVTITDVVKDASTGTVLTPEMLDGFDVFFVGQFSQEVLSLGERDLLREFVVKGGTLIVTCDIEGFDEVCNHFGYETVAGFRLVGEATYYVGKNHQLFTEPFRIEDAELPLTEDILVPDAQDAISNPEPGRRFRGPRHEPLNRRVIVVTPAVDVHPRGRRTPDAHEPHGHAKQPYGHEQGEHNAVTWSQLRGHRLRSAVMGSGER